MKTLIILFVLLLSLQSYGQIIHDESYEDESFWKFKAKLESCLLKKDLKLFKTFLADTIQESRYSCNQKGCSKDEFIKICFNKKETVWNDMLKIVRFGFHQIKNEYYNQNTFQAPSYLKTINPYEKIVVLGKNVNIRKEPNTKAKVLQQASFESFDYDFDLDETKIIHQEGISWLKIKLANKQTGYIALKFTSYPIIKEMSVMRIKGEWKIISYYHSTGC